MSNSSEAYLTAAAPHSSDHSSALRAAVRTGDFDPFGLPLRSFVARRTESGTRARLMPRTSPTCFFVLAKAHLLLDGPRPSQ